MSMRVIRRVERAIGEYPLVFLFVLFLAWCVFYLAYPTAYNRDILAPRGITDQVAFGGNVVVSQEFVPHAGISGITIPVGSDTYPDSPLILHIRQTKDSEDIVSVPIFSFHDEYAIFRFSPLWFVPPRAVWILEAPHAPKNSFWVFREKDASLFTEGGAFQNDKRIRGNIGFAETWNGPRFAAFGKSANVPLIEIASWEYSSLWFGAIVLAAYLVFRKFVFSEKVIIMFCVVLGFFLHIWLSFVTPIIIDEGAYIQDALQSSSKLLPFRDFLTKGPAYIFLLWLWGIIVPNTIVAWRLFSALVWLCGSWFFWKLTIELGLKQRSRIIAAVLFSLMPSAIALTTPLLLQTASSAVSIFGLVLALSAIKRHSYKIAAYSGLVFAVAFFIRVTAVIPALVALGVYVFLAKRGFKMRLAAAYVGTGILVFSLVFAGVAGTIGLPKTAVFMNMEAFLISLNRQEMRGETSSTADGPIRAITIESRLFMRSGILFLTPVLLLPLMLVHRKRLIASAAILIMLFLLSWNIALTLYDTNFLMPKTLPTSIFLVIALLFGVPFITALSALLYSYRGVVRDNWAPFQVPLLIVGWLAMTVFAYSKWGRFRQSYLTEYLPQLALVAGVGFDYMFDIWKKIRPVWLYRVLLASFIFLAGVSFYQGFVIAKIYPHTGTIDQASLLEVKRLIQNHVPQREMIFTAQPVATALSGRHIMFGYSHPGWYREAFFGTISSDLRDLLFKKPEEITNYLDNEAAFVLTDSRTNEIYFNDYPERKAILAEKFVALGWVPNEMAGDTYTLYRRR